MQCITIQLESRSDLHVHSHCKWYSKSGPSEIWWSKTYGSLVRKCSIKHYMNKISSHGKKPWHKEKKKLFCFLLISNNSKMWIHASLSFQMVSILSKHVPLPPHMFRSKEVFLTAILKTMIMLKVLCMKIVGLSIHFSHLCKILTLMRTHYFQNTGIVQNNDLAITCKCLSETKNIFLWAEN